MQNDAEPDFRDFKKRYESATLALTSAKDLALFLFEHWIALCTW